MSNGLYNFEITLQGPLDRPPYLARLFCRNGRLGRFLINLTRIFGAEHVTVYGRVNVRCGDILEWSNNGLRNLGLVYGNGELFSFESCYSCHKFEKSLKKYMKSKRLEYVSSYIAASIIKDDKGNEIKKQVRLGGDTEEVAIENAKKMIDFEFDYAQ